MTGFRTGASFPGGGKTEATVLNEIKRACSSDYRFSEGGVLNSICSDPLPAAVKAYTYAIHTNLGDARIFPGIKALEGMVTGMLGDLLGHPAAVGNVVSGGTEANMLAFFAALKGRRRKKPAVPEIIVPFSAHFSVAKAASMLGIRLRYTRLDSTLRADPRDIRRGINSNTIAVLATAGTSESGAVDPIREIADIAKEDGLYFHVDAASGAFIIPFAKELGYDLSEFDFKINNVSSITVDPHKFGLSVIPSGYILFRSDKIRKPIEVESHYVGTSAHTTFTGTRPGAAAASAFAAITCLGRDGFRKIVKSYFEKRDFLISELDKYGISLYAPPDLNIVLIRSRDPLKVFKRLEKRRILVSLSRRYSSIRLVVHNHVEKTHLSDFVREFAAIERKL